MARRASDYMARVAPGGGYLTNPGTRSGGGVDNRNKGQSASSGSRYTSSGRQVSSGNSGGNVLGAATTNTNPIGSIFKSVQNSLNTGGYQPAQQATDVYQDYANSIAPKQKPVKSFAEVLPEKVFVRPDLLTNTAYDTVTRDVYNRRSQASQSLWNHLGQTGGYRFGNAQVQSNQLAEYYNKLLEDQAMEKYYELYEQSLKRYEDMETDYYDDPQSYFQNPFQVPEGIDISTIPDSFVSRPYNFDDFRFSNSLLDQYNISY